MSVTAAKAIARIHQFVKFLLDNMEVFSNLAFTSKEN